jgi:hypothetical protein
MDEQPSQQLDALAAGSLWRVSKLQVFQERVRGPLAAVRAGVCKR